jgi:hypothetical protein
VTEPAADFDPGSMPGSSFSTTKAVWYRRPWVILTAVVAVVAAISVITDLPHPISRSQDIADQNGSLKVINTDLKPCAYGVAEAFRFYREESSGALSPAHRSVALTYLAEDQSVCSFAGGPVYDLTNNLQVVLTTAGKQVQDVEARTVTWVTHDANAAIKDIIGLFAHPRDPALLADLAKQEDYLAQDREAALASLARASSDLDTTLHSLNMPSLGRLPGT